MPQELLGLYTPLTLTESVKLIRTDEPFLLTKRLGKKVVNSPNETCAFEVEEGNYNLAPVGYPGDPPNKVNIARINSSYVLTPPQIYLKDEITAREINELRMAGQNPINMTSQDKGNAFDELVTTKQQGMIHLIERRLEWFFAQTLRGKYSYTSDAGREFEHDFKTPPPLGINDEWWNKKTEPGNPVHQLRAMSKYFRNLNHQMPPDMILLGGAAGDAFQNNPHVENWMKSAGVQIFQMNAGLAKGDSLSLGNLQGSDIYEYSSTYEDTKTGKAVSYIEEDYAYLTNSSMWRLYYGAIHDFDAGNPPIMLGSRFSKMKISRDGKKLDLFVESHPLPVIVSNLCVVKAKVVD